MRVDGDFEAICEGACCKKRQGLLVEHPVSCFEAKLPGTSVMKSDWKDPGDRTSMLNCALVVE